MAAYIVVEAEVLDRESIVLAESRKRRLQHFVRRRTDVEPQHVSHLVRETSGDNTRAT
jgi:hypothetical protein